MIQTQTTKEKKAENHATLLAEDRLLCENSASACTAEIKTPA